MPGFPFCERTSAPCRSCWNVIGVIIVIGNPGDLVPHQARKMGAVPSVLTAMLGLLVRDLYLFGRGKGQFPCTNNFDFEACRKLHYVLIVGIYPRSSIGLRYCNNLTIKSKFCPRTRRTTSLAL